MLEKILATVFVFGLLVFVHELGHFITAKLTGMRVDEFAIGFGPRLVSFRYGETVYSIRIVPLGGFNDIAGMAADDNDAGERGYCRKPILSRMIVILAGSAMNFILPVVLFFGIFFFAGVQTPNPAPVLGTVLADNPAANAGLMANDRVVAIDGQPIESYDPIMYRRQVSYCFQQPTLFGETVADNLAFPYQIRKQVMDTQRVVTALNNVGLSERTLHQPIIELSGGERQRVALIRNILFLPKVLLLDEVTAGLDENNKQIVHSWLRQLNEQDHVTTIMITHDATEIAAADQLAKVIAGRLEVHT